MEMREALYSLNDNELLYMMRTGDATAHRLLLDKYENYIRMMLEKYVDTPDTISMDDLNQECKILLFELSQTYRHDQGCRFLTYLVNGIQHRVSNLNRIELRKMRNFKLISLDTSVNEDSESTLLDILEPKHAFYQPEYEWRYAESVEKLRGLLQSLSEKEKVVWRLMNEKLSYEEAARRMGVTRKQFDNMRLRLKKKIVFCVMKSDHEDKH